jgi:hypothetical protein
MEKIHCFDQKHQKNVYHHVFQKLIRIQVQQIRSDFKKRVDFFKAQSFI